MNRPRRRLRGATAERKWLASIALLALTTGCADPFDLADDVQWHPAQVVRVLAPSELDDSTNRRCVEKIDPTTVQVAVVWIRVHRARHSMAFAVPAEMTLRETDNVQVNPRLCRLRSAPA